jgi:hypothetical protein
MKKKAKIKISDVELKFELETEPFSVENNRHHMFDMGKRPSAIGSDCK